MSIKDKHYCPIGRFHLHTYNYERTECIWCGPNNLAWRPGVWKNIGEDISAWSVEMNTNTKLSEWIDIKDTIGCTYRQLDYWIRTGAVKLSFDSDGSGYSRKFTESEIYAIKAVVSLHIIA